MKKKFNWKYLILISACCVEELPPKNDVRMDHYFHGDNNRRTPTEETVYQNDVSDRSNNEELEPVGAHSP